MEKHDENEAETMEIDCKLEINDNPCNKMCEVSIVFGSSRMWINMIPIRLDKRLYLAILKRFQGDGKLVIEPLFVDPDTVRVAFMKANVDLRHFPEFKTPIEVVEEGDVEHYKSEFGESVGVRKHMGMKLIGLTVVSKSRNRGLSRKLMEIANSGCEKNA